MTEQDYEKYEEELEKRAEQKPLIKKYHSSLLPHESFDVGLPNSTPKTNVILGVKIPNSTAYDTTIGATVIPNSLKKRIKY